MAHGHYPGQGGRFDPRRRSRFSDALYDRADRMQADFLASNARGSDGGAEWLGQQVEHNEYDERMAAWNERVDRGEKVDWADAPRWVERPSVLEPGGDEWED